MCLKEFTKDALGEMVDSGVREDCLGIARGTTGTGVEGNSVEGSFNMN